MNIFHYGLISFFLALIIIPLVIVFCKKCGWYDRMDHRKIHNNLTPRMGSVGFVPAYLVLSIVYLAYNCRDSLAMYLPLAAAGTLIFVFGVIDDYCILRARFKLIIHVTASIIPVIAGFQITHLGPINLGFTAPVITFFWFLGLINAFNLIDGIDALCASLSFSILATVGLVLAVNGSIFCSLPFILAGGIAGFLMFNKPKAKIFMGDGGSQFLGFIIAALPLMGATESMKSNLFFMTIVLASIPILDTFAAIWRRVREKRHIFSPDKAHVHHKLMNIGYSSNEILFILLPVQIVLCFVSFAAVVWSTNKYIILCGSFIAMITFFSVIHFKNRAVLKDNYFKVTAIKTSDTSPADDIKTPPVSALPKASLEIPSK